MPATDLSRRGFLTTAAALTLASGTTEAMADQPAPASRLERALCLSGGGARGAYEAGVIDYLRSSKQLSDGSALSPYGIVTGTSIGAINGYFVATAQYSLLRDLWYQIADQNVFVLKRRYAKAANPDSGIGTRFAAALRMVVSLAKNDTGVIDGSRLRSWLSEYIDPNKTPVMPFVWPVTNLTTQSPEFFFIVGSALSQATRERAAAAVRATVGPSAVLREATPDILLDALIASTAIPVAFDPIALPSPNGKSTNLYVDGGVTANTPIGVARAAAANVDVIMVDPPFHSATYANAFEIGLGVFGAMQRRILESDLRAAYLESNRQSNFYVLHPNEDLEVSVIGFDDGVKLYASYKAGYADAAHGFQPYVFET